jgi:hypothetical protein
MVATKGAAELFRQLYPREAGARSAFFPLLARWKVLALGALAALVALGLMLWLLDLHGVAFPVLLSILFFYTSRPLSPAGRRRSDTAQVKIVDALAALLQEGGYRIVRTPRTDKAEIDPLLKSVDLLAQTGDRAFAVQVKSVASGAPVEWERGQRAAHGRPLALRRDRDRQRRAGVGRARADAGGRDDRAKPCSVLATRAHSGRALQRYRRCHRQSPGAHPSIAGCGLGVPAPTSGIIGSGMSDPTAIENPIPGLRAGEADSDGAAALTRLGRAITPDLRPDPRAALRDTRIKGKLRTDLQEFARSSGLSLEDDTAEDPYADADGHTLKRHFTVLKSAADEVVLLQIEDWMANDGANVGAMDEMRDAFTNRKVRIVAEKVQTPSLSLEKTMPRIWRQRAMVDVEFVSWRYVAELLERKLSPVQVFGLAAGAAPASPAKPAEKKTIESVFISSTGLDLHEYREAARDD